jgi:hypothetical protein
MGLGWYGFQAHGELPPTLGVKHMDFDMCRETLLPTDIDLNG